MAAEGSNNGNPFGDDINSTPLDKLSLPPTTRMTSEFTSRKGAMPIEPIAYKPNIEVDAPPPPVQQEPQAELRRRRPRAPAAPAAAPAAAGPPIAQPMAPYYYPAHAVPMPLRPEPLPAAAPPPDTAPKRGWLTSLERHGRAATVAFLVFAILWYAAPKLAAAAAWMRTDAEGPALSMPAAVLTSLVAGAVFATLDRLILTVG